MDMVFAGILCPPWTMVHRRGVSHNPMFPEEWWPMDKFPTRIQCHLYVRWWFIVRVFCRIQWPLGNLVAPGRQWTLFSRIWCSLRIVAMVHGVS